MSEYQPKDAVATAMALITLAVRIHDDETSEEQAALMHDQAVAIIEDDIGSAENVMQAVSMLSVVLSEQSAALLVTMSEMSDMDKYDVLSAIGADLFKHYNKPVAE